MGFIYYRLHENMQNKIRIEVCTLDIYVKETLLMISFTSLIGFGMNALGECCFTRRQELLIAVCLPVPDSTFSFVWL